MTKAIALGALAAVLLGYGSSALYEFAGTEGSENLWLSVVASPAQTLVSLAPGFIAGWLCHERGIISGLAAGLLGNVLYSAMFGTFWSTVLEGGVSSVAYTLLWLVLMAISWGLYGAVAGGTAQLLRSNKPLQATRENARA